MSITCTMEKILDASIMLFSQKGYYAVTTKEIAKEAGVSEMTVYRHFESKQKLFEKAFEKYVFVPKFTSLFEKNMAWDLNKDLLKISCEYHDTLRKNQKTILMQFKNYDLTSHEEAPFLKFPNELKKLLVNYFISMRERGLLNQDPEVLACCFLSTNFGFFMTYLLNSTQFNHYDFNKLLESYVEVFVKGVCSKTL